MYLKSLTLQHFRNFAGLEADFPEPGAVIIGDNGAGKTSLLEAIHLLCTGRSQRGASRADMIHFSSSAAYVEGSFTSHVSGGVTSASIGFSKDKKVRMKCNGSSITSMTDWLNHGVVISFGPDDLALIAGSPSHRRRFVDIFLSQLDHEYLRALISYRKLLFQRNALLTTKPETDQLDVYDYQMSEHASFIAARRKELIDHLKPLFQHMYASICGCDEQADIRYQHSPQGGSISSDSYRTEFFQRRAHDMRYGYTTAGPHRDDIAILLNSHVSRSFASQGQCRSLALALRLASVQVMEQRSSEPLLFLVDDAISELDPGRMQRIFPLVRGRGQLLIATPCDNPSLPPFMPRMHLREGELRHV